MKDQLIRNVDGTVCKDARLKVFKTKPAYIVKMGLGRWEIWRITPTTKTIINTVDYTDGKRADKLCKQYSLLADEYWATKGK